MGISRSSYYDQADTQTRRDEVAVTELRQVHAEHPLYGVCRLSLHLRWSPKKTRRIRDLAGIVVLRPTKKRRTGKGVTAEIPVPKNALQPYATFKNERRPQDGQHYLGMTEARAWVQDFTYLWFERSWCYLAVVLDLTTRQVVGWQLGLAHSSNLTHIALLDALSKHQPPAILHSDQGSEYLSFRHQNLCDRMGIVLSCSAKSSPWQNGFMERFFLTLKTELPPLTGLNGLAQLHEAVALAIHYYNTRRIHTSLQMAPAAYARTLAAGQATTR